MITFDKLLSETEEEAKEVMLFFAGEEGASLARLDLAEIETELFEAVQSIVPTSPEELLNVALGNLYLFDPTMELEGQDGADISAIDIINSNIHTNLLAHLLYNQETWLDELKGQ